MGKIITCCPSCKSSNLHVVKIECSGCNTRFEGQFEISNLLKLPEDDLQFILDFVKCSGSLKDMAKLQSVSYPTLRNRLNTIINSIGALEDKKQNSKEDILKQLEVGEITAKEATLLLMNL